MILLLFFKTQWRICLNLKMLLINQSLVGLVVIGAELGREDHSSIPRNCDRERNETT
jgi:hypothetical protein